MARAAHGAQPAARLLRLAGVGVMAGVGVASWSVWEARARYVLREWELPAQVASPLTVLHLSDLHMTGSTRARRDFVHRLAQLPHDFVALTGDNLGGSDGLPLLLDALEPLLDGPGAFVFGSNDYFGPKLKSPHRYFVGPRVVPTPFTHELLPAEELAATLEARGWFNANNARSRVEVPGGAVDVVGVNDPHIERDEWPAQTPRAGDAIARLALIHAPYVRALDAARAEGVDLALVGHTHGGQVCVPGFGALVTNSDMPLWRASGLQGWPGLRPDGWAITPRRLLQPVPPEMRAAEDAARRTYRDTGAVPPDVAGNMWLNISAGLGTSRYAPVRLACRPEASLLHLVPAPA